MEKMRNRQIIISFFHVFFDFLDFINLVFLDIHCRIVDFCNHTLTVSRL